MKVLSFLCYPQCRLFFLFIVQQQKPYQICHQRSETGAPNARPTTTQEHRKISVEKSVKRSSKSDFKRGKRNQLYSSLSEHNKTREEGGGVGESDGTTTPKMHLWLGFKKSPQTRLMLGNQVKVIVRNQKTEQADPRETIKRK